MIQPAHPQTPNSLPHQRQPQSHSQSQIPPAQKEKTETTVIPVERRDQPTDQSPGRPHVPAQHTRGLPSRVRWRWYRQCLECSSAERGTCSCCCKHTRSKPGDCTRVGGAWGAMCLAVRQGARSRACINHPNHHTLRSSRTLLPPCRASHPQQKEAAQRSSHPPRQHSPQTMQTPNTKPTLPGADTQGACHPQVKREGTVRERRPPNQLCIT